MKRCTTCCEEKPLDEFHRRTLKSGKLSYQHDCKSCQSNRVKQRYRDGAYDYASMNRRAYLIRTYGITPEEYDTQFTKQGGLCLVCQRPENRPTKRGNTAQRRLAVHHCHITGKNLALLCVDCNRAMGMMQDDPERLMRAALLGRGELTGAW